MALWKAFMSGRPIVAVSLHNVATQLAFLGRHEEALPLFERSVHIEEDARGPAHPGIADTLDAWAESLAALGKETAALALLSRAREIRGTQGPPEPSRH